MKTDEFEQLFGQNVRRKIRVFTDEKEPDCDHEWEEKKGEGLFAHWMFKVCKKCNYEQPRTFTAEEFWNKVRGTQK